MGNVKFKVWENPPTGKIAEYIRESAYNAAITVDDISAGKNIITDGFGSWPDVLCNELKQFEDRFKSRS